ncbi:HpcH/HpaI aldolase family protein [Streptomyces sp. NPDC003730]
MTASVPRRPSLKRRLAAGERLYGALLRLPSETLVEMAGVAGLDYVVLDCEHGPADMTALQHHLTAAAAQGVEVLVRVGTAEPALALRCLDLGAAGVIHPHVDSAADARRAVSADHYPPLGQRGFATYSRTGRFGTVTAREHLAAGEDTLVVVMIETERACAAAGEITATRGVDAVLVGPSDLAADCGFPGRDVIDGLTEGAHRAARAAGRAVMTIVPSTAAAREAEEAGAQLVLFNMAAVLMDTFRSLAPPRTGRRTAAPSAPAPCTPLDATPDAP